REVEVVPFEMAKALKLKEDPTRSMEEVLVDFIGEKSLLIVLDNFEQIVGAVSLIENLLSRCANLHIIVSSRICLNAEGEYEYKLPPLLLPSGNGNGSQKEEKLIGYPSIALFMDRASSYGKKIELSDHELGIVSSICEKLDGLPLAIELAAARVKLFSIEELLPKLANPLDVLKGNRKFADRHKTLRNTISWSYDLLSTEEKNLLTQLSIFVGGCSMESILEVCEGIEDEFDLLDDLTVLIDNSLLISVEYGSQQRFTLLELIKEFGLERLEENQRLDSLKRNHIKYFTSLAQKGIKEVAGPNDEFWSDLFFQELPNFRAAITYALELKEMQLAYDLGIALRDFWRMKGMTTEGIQQLERITAQPVHEELYPEKLKVLQTLGFLYFLVPIPEKAIPILEECYNYWRNKDDQERLGLILNDWGWANMMIGNYRKCEDLTLEALDIFENLIHNEGLISSHRNIGFAYMNRSQPLKAIPHFKKWQKLAVAEKNYRDEAYALCSIGQCSYLQGDYDLAIKQIQGGIEILQRIKDKNLEAYGNSILSLAFLFKGDFEEFNLVSSRALKLAEDTGAKYAVVMVNTYIAITKISLKNYEEARLILEEVYLINKRLNFRLCSDFYSKTSAYLALQTNNVTDAKSLVATQLKGQLQQRNFYALTTAMEMGAMIAYREQKFESSAALYWGSKRWRSELQIPLYAYEKQNFLDLQQQLEESLSLDVLQSVKSAILPLEDLVNMAEEIFLS
ncbi:MAG: hypothetical protein AAF824_21220, partial [Bacteroidota bacterium]